MAAISLSAHNYGDHSSEIVVRISNLFALILATASPLLAQPDMKPTNDLPNPYRTVEGWAKMPEGRTWGSTSAVAIDRDGVSVWVAERCGANNCVGSTLDPVLHFDATGKLVKSFGAGMILSPHGIVVDKDDNIWVVDCACTIGGGRGRGRGAAPGAPPPPVVDSTKGHQIFKFSPEGKLLMTLGTAGGARAPGYFYQPNDLLIAPNGDIFVVEGHSSQQGRSPAAVLKFDKTGKLLARWGTVVDTTRKDEPYSFNQPHALAMDSKGRLFVGDRGYNRIKIFTQDGKLLDTWYQFSRPSGIFIDKDDRIYVADSESGSVNPAHGAWLRGIRIGSARTGKVVAFIPDPNPNARGTSAAEGVAVDSKGIIYGAEVGPKALKRYERMP
jgi:sugar lactone lactonase YvrE